MWFMIRKLQKTDINRVADIWLDTNLKAHDFIPAKYWKNNFQLVKEYVMDWTSWIKSSCWSWCRRHVYVVFTRVSFDVENGRTGTGSTMHWTRRQRRSP